MCPAVVVTTSRGSNCVVTFILECPVYVHLKHKVTTQFDPVDVVTTTAGHIIVLCV